MLGKTRQSAEVEEAFDEAAGKPRGVLRTAVTAGKFRHGRRAPAPDLAGCIDHYWIVSWALRGEEPQVVETLPHPNFHLVFERNHSTVNGVFTGKFRRTLEGLGQAFGIKFQPGGFRPFLNAAAASMANRSVAAESIFDPEEIAQMESILISSSIAEDEKVAAADSFLLRHLPVPNAAIASAGQLVRRILEEPEIRTVDELAARAAISKRSLQRIFQEYIGAAPKWVIRRYRLHELVEQLHNGKPPDYAVLAQELGYFDQAHLIRDFRLIVGYSPAQYRKRNA